MKFASLIQVGVFRISHASEYFTIEMVVPRVSGDMKFFRAARTDSVSQDFWANHYAYNQLYYAIERWKTV